MITYGPMTAGDPNRPSAESHVKSSRTVDEWADALTESVARDAASQVD
jgi:hypothetical protein